jgi:hypothetical protein
VATKKRKSAKPKAPEIVMPPAPPVIDLGKRIALTVKRTSADEITFELSDGAKVLVKPVLMGIERSLQKYNAAGDPLYQVNAGLMVNVVVPKKLKRKLKS